MATAVQRPSKTVQTTPEQRIVLHGVSWETYERLLADHLDRRSPRFAYDRGELEIVSPSFEHERVNGALADVVRVVSEELGIDTITAGTMTVRRADLGRGFEPDSSFYVQRAGRVRGKMQIDVRVDPPPDLVIEIDLTHSSLNKLPLYAELGVPEVWRYRGGQVTILVLEGDTYREAPASRALPVVTAGALTRFVQEDATMARPAWLRAVRDWTRQHGAAEQATD